MERLGFNVIAEGVIAREVAPTLHLPFVWQKMLELLLELELRAALQVRLAVVCRWHAAPAVGRPDSAAARAALPSCSMPLPPPEALSEGAS
eukprot:1726978-Rhodomonas_salina.1